ncbi:hypothetical protein J6590_024949 [Homalodisca vitripennis]|nr:hypothetical protein J6590_024949 [Homalodisca vitripennis]
MTLAATRIMKRTTRGCVWVLYGNLPSTSPDAEDVKLDSCCHEDYEEDDSWLCVGAIWEPAVYFSNAEDVKLDSCCHEDYEEDDSWLCVGAIWEPAVYFSRC